jgi:hypothetical protein
MHVVMWLTAFTFAFLARWGNQATGQAWNQRWHKTLTAFALPPLVLLMTAIAIVLMGPQGQMGHWHEGWVSYGCAIGGLAGASGLGFVLALQAQRTLAQVRRCPTREIQGHPTRLLENPLPFVAQIGFWAPELVVSQGLLTTLDAEHLEAVFVHEQAHRHYRDTFWFFWLGWLRRLTAWLPQTEALWQELLLLREIRADLWAAQAVDQLLLAEALLTVASAPSQPWDSLGVGLENAAIRDRLTERIDALLGPPQPLNPISPWVWSWLLLTLLPLLALPFHT